MEVTHALSLKVMRISRPTLATHSAPYFTEPNGGPLTEHARASILSLEGPTPLDSYPTTLRDYPLTDILLLPASFGSIQLGENFAAVVCVNNDSLVSSSMRGSTSIDTSSVHLRIEIQSTSNKFAIGETGGEDTVLKAGGYMECKVQTEMKELGQHVLACTLTYRIPSFVAATYPIPPDDPSDPTLRTLRKYYKFMVTNPLSVKTKVQTPKAPNALLIPSEREKVFLEVHLQNLSSGPMTFQRISFECAPGSGMTVQDVNDGLYDGIHAGMAPGDTRQYLYILTPGEGENDVPGGRRHTAAKHEPGSVIPLGRLDIAWTSSFGEPGRLLTSMLSRKIPPLPVSPPAAWNTNPNTSPVIGTQLSSLPPHMHPKTVIPQHLSGATSSISRPQSPNVSAPASASSSRPSSPFRIRTVPGPDAAGRVTQMMRSQSPSVASPDAVTPIDNPVSVQEQGTALPNLLAGGLHVAHETPNHSIEATLSVRSICAKSAELGDQWASTCVDRLTQLGGRINVQEPFRVWFELSVRQTANPFTRTEKISIQRMEARPLGDGVGGPSPTVNVLSIGGAVVHTRGAGLISPSGDRYPISGAPVTSPPSTIMSPDPPHVHPVSARGSCAVAGISVSDAFSDHIGNKGGYSLQCGFPAPFVEIHGKGTVEGEAGSAVAENVGGIVRIGPSLVTLGLEEALPSNDAEDRYGFALEYMALRKGLQSLGGGVRVYAGDERVLEVNMLGDLWVS